MSIDQARPRTSLQPHHLGAPTGRRAGACTHGEDPAVHSRRHLWLTTLEQRGLDHRP
jgi:hypothetical protein